MRAEDIADSDGGGIQVVEFLLEEERYAVDVTRVGSIVKPKKITRLPRAPDSVEGIMDLRGETTPVIDPKKLFDLDRSNGKRQILVMEQAGDNKKVGMLVDEVVDVASFGTEQVDLADEVQDLNTKGLDENMVKGVLRRGAEGGTELVIWVDVDRVLDVGNEAQAA